MSQPLQLWSAEDYAANGRFVSDLGAPVLDLLAPAPGMRVLDLGCGDGALTAKIEEAGAEVLGVDASAELLAAARERGLTVMQIDAHRLPFDSEFDAVFSNAALHWMLEPDKVLDGVARALKPGGRFVAEFGGHGNVAAIATALRAVAARHGIPAGEASPWFFPTPDRYAGLLRQAGFEVEHIALIPRPTPLPGDVAAWLATFGAFIFDRLGREERDAAIAEATRLLRPSLCDERGRWTADYVRLRFAAILRA